MSNPNNVFDVTEETFETDVLVRSQRTPVLVDFWASWCQPCRLLAPILSNIAREFEDRLCVAKVDVDQAPRLANQFQVSAIPFVVLFDRGQVVGQFAGVQPEPAIREFLSRVLPTDSDRVARQAVELEASDPMAALDRYREAIELNPRNTEAIAAAASLCLDLGLLAEAKEFLGRVSEGDKGWERAANAKARIEFTDQAASLGSIEESEEKVKANPNDPQSRFELGILHAAGGNFREALEHLLAAIEINRDWGAKHAKAPMVKIFGLVGPQSELANEYRSRLARSLY